MADSATDLLSKAIGARIAQRQHAPAKAEEGHSYSVECPACKAAIQFSDEDLDRYRTDDETSATGDDDDENDEDEPEDRASALAASLIKAAKQKHD
jgi:hypothetical protein